MQKQLWTLLSFKISMELHLELKTCYDKTCLLRKCKFTLAKILFHFRFLDNRTNYEKSERVADRRCNQSLFRVRSAFRRRDNHISRAITCLCISIIPWRRSPGILARIPRIFYCCALPSGPTRPRTPTGCRCAAERGGARDGGLQRTTLISLIELSTRDCCNYDYL